MDRGGLTPENMKKLVLSSAPMLAGFTLPTITLLLTSDPKNLPALREQALWSFVLATGLLIWSVQVGALARDDSKRTIYFAGGIYALGILSLVAALGFLFWPGTREGSVARIGLVIFLAVVIVGGTVAVALREYWCELHAKMTTARNWWARR